jgi:hypothetical protein
MFDCTRASLCFSRSFEVSDTLLDVSYILGIDAVLRRIAEVIQVVVPRFTAEMAAVAARPGSRLSDEAWKPLDACLFCIRGVAERVDIRESVVLPPVIDLVLQLPPIPDMQCVGRCVRRSDRPGVCNGEVAAVDGARRLCAE